MRDAKVQDMLDDPSLIQTLDQSKKTSIEINERVQQQQVTEVLL
jgi:hypothetical protein